MPESPSQNENEPNALKTIKKYDIFLTNAELNKPRPDMAALAYIAGYCAHAALERQPCDDYRDILTVTERELQNSDYVLIDSISQGDQRIPGTAKPDGKNHRERNMLLFASRQTTESLRVTLMLVLDIIDGLHKAGIPYILTRFFGVVRSFHGDDDHPTIVQFGQEHHGRKTAKPGRCGRVGNLKHSDKNRFHMATTSPSCRRDPQSPANTSKPELSRLDKTGTLPCSSSKHTPSSAATFSLQDALAKSRKEAEAAKVEAQAA
ncbi:hypothetical protein HPB51_011354 [Rhipicephalus microplus]|uniref:Uncharacterized protein n=1 Tax=Rhipicephalus microplus TaxID=6941 RepID=A0A9J6DG70_RHIMP|nr:hypothetical protein HPB51_011354 [Rhipicephalus microplus]